MKRILLAIVLGSLSLFNNSEANPRSKVFVFDMDDVFVSMRKWHVGSFATMKGLSMMPSFSWRMATNRTFRKKFKAIFSKKNKFKDPESYHNGTFKLAAVARIYKPMRKSFDSFMKRVNYSGRSLINDVIAVIKDLKDRGYTVIVATNRDRVGFELTAKKLKFDQLYHGKQLFDAVITAGTKDFVQYTTMSNGRRFSCIKPNPAYDTYITQAPAFKPDKAYYEVVRQVVNNYAVEHADKFDTVSPEIIFFDDKKENIDGANKSGLNIVAYQIPAKHKGASLRKNASYALDTVLA